MSLRRIDRPDILAIEYIGIEERQKIDHYAMIDKIVEQFNIVIDAVNKLEARLDGLEK